MGAGAEPGRHRRSSMPPRAHHRASSMVLSWPTGTIQGPLWWPSFRAPALRCVFFFLLFFFFGKILFLVVVLVKTHMVFLFSFVMDLLCDGLLRSCVCVCFVRRRRACHACVVDCDVVMILLLPRYDCVCCQSGAMRCAMRVPVRRSAQRAYCKVVCACVSTSAQSHAEGATAAMWSISSHPPGNCSRAFEGHRACECERVEELRRPNVHPSILHTGGRVASK